jgi:hypothetical protein
MISSDSNGLRLDSKRSIVIITNIHSGFWRSGGVREISSDQKAKNWREAYTCIVQEMKGDIVSQVYPVERSRRWNSEIEIGGFEFTSHTFAQLPRYYSLSSCT